MVQQGKLLKTDRAAEGCIGKYKRLFQPETAPVVVILIWMGQVHQSRDFPTIFLKALLSMDDFQLDHNLRANPKTKTQSVAKQEAKSRVMIEGQFYDFQR